MDGEAIRVRDVDERMYDLLGLLDQFEVSYWDDARWAESVLEGVSMPDTVYGPNNPCGIITCRICYPLEPGGRPVMPFGIINDDAIPDNEVWMQMGGGETIRFRLDADDKDEMRIATSMGRLPDFLERLLDGRVGERIGVDEGTATMETNPVADVIEAFFNGKDAKYTQSPNEPLTTRGTGGYAYASERLILLAGKGVRSEVRNGVRTLLYFDPDGRDTLRTIAVRPNDHHVWVAVGVAPSGVSRQIRIKLAEHFDHDFLSDVGMIERERTVDFNRYARKEVT